MKSAESLASQQRIARAGWIALAVGLAVFALKMVAALRTHSLALWSDALESIVNVVAAAAAVVATRIASRPADEDHPFGHAKIEYVSVGLEGALIVGAGVAIITEAIRRFGRPLDLPELGIGLGLAVVASVANALLALHLLRVGRRERSPALVADGRHVASDVVSSGAALAGLGLAWATGWWEIDALVAFATALHLGFVGARTAREALGGLMDEALAADERAAIARVVAESGTEAIEVHDLRTRRAGRTVFVDFHLVLPGTWTVTRAHAICDRLEHEIGAAVPGAEVSIHVEPEGEARGGSFLR